MTMIDTAIEDVAGRFGLGPKAGQLVQELVHLITGSPGGVIGFIDKFRSAGLGSEVASWLGRTDGAALAGPQVERALGSTALGGIASRLGLGSGVVATAIGYILPKLIGQITPGGVIPAGIPASLSWRPSWGWRSRSGSPRLCRPSGFRGGRGFSSWWRRSGYRASCSPWRGWAWTWHTVDWTRG